MNPPTSPFIGCLLGLACGDALGAPYEGGIPERLAWSLIGKTKEGLPRWTDDTQMSLDVAASLLAHGDVDQNDLAQAFQKSYRWSRGYGPGTAKVLSHIRAGQPWQQASRASYKDGSIGNGGAMRIPVVSMFYHGQPLDILLEKTRLVTEITHAHPAAIEGAALVALCVSCALQGFPMADALKYFVTAYPGTLFLSKVHRLQTLVTSHTTPSPSEIVHQFGNGIVALDSCVTAMAIAHCFKDKPFQSLVEFTAQCKGDVDTIAAMAGAWWGATNGDAGLQKIAIEDREAIVRVGEQLYAHISSYCN